MKYNFLALIAFLFLHCNTSDKKQSGQQSDPSKQELSSNEKMALRLKQIADNANPQTYSILNSSRAELFRMQMQNVADPNERLSLYFMHCSELLFAGKTQEAISALQNLNREAGFSQEDINDNNKPIFDLLAVAHLRLGEQENCIINHTGESCIIPLHKNGLHQLKQGSTAAIALYLKILEKYPDDLNSVWLLNVAYMTLGEFPDKVPAQWRLPASAFNSRGNFPKFENIAANLGIDHDGRAGGCCIEDFNNDGFLDILSSSWSLRDPLHFLVNNGDGSFSDKTSEAGLNGLVSGLNLLHADYNNDGNMDVLVLRGAWLATGGNIPNSLLRNNGDGTFTDVTMQSGIYSEHPTQTAVWRDFNLDGHLDLFIGNESGNGYTNPCEFFWNNGNGTFTEMGNKLNLAIVGFVKGSTAGDVNNDGLPDLYLSLLGGMNKLFINRGGSTTADWKFEETGTKAGVQEPFWSFPAWFWDYDNDGLDDLYVCGYQFDRFTNVAEDQVRTIKGLPSIAELPRLYHNNGNGTFTDVSKQAGVSEVIYAMGSNFEDINNDGFLDFYLGTGVPDLRAVVPNKMFLNQNGKSFLDVTYDGGFGHLQKGHAIGFGDMDNDGDEDVYADIGGAFEGDNFRNAFFENPGNENNWIVLQLEGNKANRAAIGAKVRFTITENGKKRAIYRTVNTGGSFGASSLQLEVGIGSASVADEIQITWPNATQTVQTFTNVQGGKKYKLIESAAQLIAVDYKIIHWKKKSHEHHAHM